MAEQLRVMISSTARDLPEHRQKVMDACMRLGMFYPDMMEHLTASDANALEVSLKIADRAQIYVGVFAFRYGYVPDGQSISVTESEYNRAVERGIPRLIFLMSDQHNIKPGDFETGEGAEKLKALKERLKKERVVGFFDSEDDLKAQVIQALVPYRESNIAEFHYVSDIPAPPEVYIAHPYTLLQTHTLIGRQRELKLLTDWITDKELELDGHKAPADSVRIMNVVAIGGMGKSALTWKWFNDIAPQEMKNLAGRMWWSFYESDATFENFVTRALAYVTKRPLDEVQKTPAPERETQLLVAFDHQPFLFVLDGLERILIAYARMDAARLDDSEVGKEKNLRKTADPRVGSFLKKLAQVKHSRILVSSRLYPTELETTGGDSIPGTFGLKIDGLNDEDAVELWRAFDVSGSRDELLPVFNTFSKHPLLIQALAGEVKRYRKAPGNFEEWRKANPKFDPSKFTKLQDAMAHVLEFALRGLDVKTEKGLHTIAAFRMPTSYDTLAAVLAGEGNACTNEPELDAVLNELEDRGLVGWDKRANRYDLHPIVRGVVWSGLGDDARRGVYTSLHVHFEAVPMIDDYVKVHSLEDLTPAIELYNTLIGLGRYDDALKFFYERLDKAMLYRLSANRQRVELLELLFPDGLDQLPRLNSQSDQAVTLHMLAQGYQFSGQPGRAAALYRRATTIYSEMSNDNYLSIALINLSNPLRFSASLRESEAVARQALLIMRAQANRDGESASLNPLGIALTARGRQEEAGTALDRSLAIATKGNAYKSFDYQAMRALWVEDFRGAKNWAKKALDYCRAQLYERGEIRAVGQLGASALGLYDFAAADERLHDALTRARKVNLIEEELPALVALAELRRRQGDAKAAREVLDDVWEATERGSYRLFHTDALNVLTQIEHDEGNTQAAIEAATKAYRLAWCDGPPFAYHWGLEKAKQHLKELGAPEPEMPPFDESKFEPMPEVEINPDDEFHVGDDAVN